MFRSISKFVFKLVVVALLFGGLTPRAALAHYSLSCWLLSKCEKECVAALVENAVPLSKETTASLCAKASHWQGIKTLRLVVSNQKDLPESTLKGVIDIQNRWGYRCIAALVNNRFQIDFGDRVVLCSKAHDSMSLTALESIASTQRSLSDQALARILQVELPKPAADPVSVGEPIPEN